MKNWIYFLVLSIGTQAAAFATHDMPAVKPTHAKLNKTYGAPVKLDLSYNRCVERSEEEYKHTLFYEEFESMQECLKSQARG